MIALDEPILDPGLPIVDTHHHLWSGTIPALAQTTGGLPYLAEDYLKDAEGHAVVASVFIQSYTNYRADGPDSLRSVGEIEFAAGQAAIADSGGRVAAGLVGQVDLTIGDQVAAVLEAHMEAGKGRFRGIRQMAPWDADSSIIGAFSPGQGLYRSDAFRAGFAQLGRHALSFDAFVLAPQIPDVTSLAGAFPDTSLVLNHVGVPLGIGAYAGRRAEHFKKWYDDMLGLSRCPNAFVKLGGLGTRLSAFPSWKNSPRADGDSLAQDWRPYIETAIALFGPRRCMFESNFPVERETGSFTSVWNAFKRITASYGQAEKEALFADTGAAFYRIDISNHQAAGCLPRVD